MKGLSPLPEDRETKELTELEGLSLRERLELKIRSSRDNLVTERLKLKN